MSVRFRGFFNNKKRHIAKQNGFSLIELTAVIGIAAATTIGFLSWTQPDSIVESQKIIKTNDQMQKIAKAIEAFRVQRGRLPCPADPYMTAENTRNGGGTDHYVNDFGQEDLDTTQTIVNSITTLGIDCPARTGALPVYALGLPKKYINDAWDRRFTYQVSASLCGSDAGIDDAGADVDDLQSALTGCTKNDYTNNIGDIIIKDASAGSVITNKAAYVLVSHGANGAGAFIPSGAKLAGGADADELINNNLDTTSEADLLRRTFIKKPIVSGGYDDLTLFKTKIQIDRVTDNKNTKQISVADCEANSAAIKNITATHTTAMNAEITGYVHDSFNKGEQVAMGLLNTIQKICVSYYGADSATINGVTWNGAQCPGNDDPATHGSTYFAPTETCSCLGSAWDGDCTMDWTVVMPVKTDLQLWLDANQTSAYTDTECLTEAADTNTVACWKDKSGNGNNFLQSTAGSRPVYNLSTIATKPVITFNGSSQYLEIPYNASLNDTEYTIMSVVEVNGGSGSYRSPFTTRDASPNQGYIIYATSSNDWEIWTGTSGTWGGISNPGAPAVELATPVMIVGTSTANAQAVRVDGAQVGTSSVSYDANSQWPSRLGAGATEETTPAVYFNGDIAETIIYNRALTTTEISNMEEYLSQKWGITIP